MNIFTLLGRKSSAPVARERLQILLSHERTTNCNADLIALLQQEVLAGLAKHIDIDPSQVQIKMKRREDVSLLEIDVEIPTPKAGRTPASPKPDATMPTTGRAGEAA